MRVLLSIAAGLAVLWGGAAAYAQAGSLSSPYISGERPREAGEDWRLRFTPSAPAADGANQWLAPEGQNSSRASFLFGSKVGVTLQRDEFAPVLLLPREPRPTEEVSAGAFWQITPRFRVGGEISFSARDGKDKAISPLENPQSPRVQGSFRF